MMKQEILLTTQQIITLGHRVSAVTDIIGKFNNANEPAPIDVYMLLEKELDTIGTILMSIDDKDNIEELGMNTKEGNK